VGLDEDVLRAVAVVSRGGGSPPSAATAARSGLFQVRRPFHCTGKCAIARRSTAFNADYYGGIIRAYFDGRMAWLNKEPHGRKYGRPVTFGAASAPGSPAAGGPPPPRANISQVQQRLANGLWLRRFLKTRKVRRSRIDGRVPWFSPSTGAVSALFRELRGELEAGR